MASAFVTALLCGVLLLPVPGRAEEKLPARFQAVLFKKILLYAPNLGERPLVLIPYSDGGSADAEDIAKAFQEVGLRASVVKPTELAASVKAGNVVYFFPGLPASLRDVVVGTKAISISGSAGMAERGEAAIGVAKTADGRPQIIISRRRLKSEGQELSSDLLALAKVVE